MESTCDCTYVQQPLLVQLHVLMPQHGRLECSSSSSSEGCEQIDTLSIGQAYGHDDSQDEHSFFTPLQSVVGPDSSVHASFDGYIPNLPAKNSHIISDERFKRFVRIFKGKTPEEDHAQLKRYREKLYNTKELGPKARDGTRFPFGTWELRTCMDTRTGEHIERLKRTNTYKGGLQAMVPASECEAVIHKLHMLGGHKGQERTWKDICGAYHGISEDIVKAYVKNCTCTALRAGRSAKRKRAGTAMWAPSAWFHAEADLIDMTDQPTFSEGVTYQYILQIIDQKTLFTLLAPLERKTACEVSKHLYRWFAEHGVPQVFHTDTGGEFTGTVFVTEFGASSQACALQLVHLGNHGCKVVLSKHTTPCTRICTTFGSTMAKTSTGLSC